MASRVVRDFQTPFFFFFKSRKYQEKFKFVAAYNVSSPTAAKSYAVVMSVKKDLCSVLQILSLFSESTDEVAGRRASGKTIKKK